MMILIYEYLKKNKKEESLVIIYKDERLNAEIIVDYI